MNFKTLIFSILGSAIWAAFLVFVIDESLQKAEFSYLVINFYDLFLTLVVAAIYAILVFSDKKVSKLFGKDMKQTLIDHGNITG
jgi:membrane protein DedA with SNARE-associated domain